MTTPIRVAVTGAAGNIAYSLIWRIASGDCFGKDQPVILNLLEITPALGKLEGVVMELIDSAFPLLHGVEATDDANRAFDGAGAVFLVGSRPRTKDMTRADLIRANGPIFTGQGQALNRARHDVKVITVGNPCNTNALIANHGAGDIPSSQITAMTRLDQNRAEGLIAQRLGLPASEVRNVIVWGNHGPTMYPDVSIATAGGRPVLDQIDGDYLRGPFIDVVSDRGRAIIEARGASSAASAASAAVDHMHDWHVGTGDRIVSMAIVSQGEYGIPAGLVFSMPVRCAGGSYQVVEGLDIDAFGRAQIDKNVKALTEERDAVADLLV